MTLEPDLTPDTILPRSGSLYLLETSVQVLFARLTRAGWSVAESDKPLALCFCALLIKLDPAAQPGRVAPLLAGQGEDRFDQVALTNAMAALGYRYLTITARPSEIDARLMPAILMHEQEAALCHVEDENVVVLDGRTATHMPLESWSRSTEVLIFSRIPEDMRPTSRAALENSGRTWFVEILRRFIPQVKFMLVISIMLNLLSLSVPLFILLIYDRVLNVGAIEPLLYLGYGVVIILVAEYLLRRAKAGLLSHVMARLDFIVGTASFERLINLPPAILDKAELSEQIARIKTFESVRDFLCGPLMGTALDMPVVVLSLMLMLVLGGPLVLVPMVAAALLAGLTWRARRPVGILIRRAAIESSKMQQFALDCFSKLDSIQLDGLTGNWLELYRAVSGREQMAQLRLALHASRTEILAQCLAGLSTLALLFVGAHLIWADRMAAGALIACLVLHMRILAPFLALSGMVPRLEQMRNAIRQINELMVYDVEDSDSRTITSTRLDGAIRISNVSLRYAPRTPLVYNGFNLDVRAGEVVGITGSNGSGKTTLLKMILGLVEPQLGGIRLSGFDIRQLNPQNLRSQVSYVPQNVDFFTGTIAENLRFGMPMATEAELAEALRGAGAWETVAALPAGLDTPLDPAALRSRDPHLHDRLALARALLRPAKILLIDERPATLLRSGLDDTLRDCIAAERNRRTILFVTHRTDLLRVADRVVALRGEGRVDVGTLDKILGAAA